MQNASGFGGGATAATPPAGGGGFMAMGGDGGLSAVQSAINDYLNGAEAIHQAEGVALSDVHLPSLLPKPSLLTHARPLANCSPAISISTCESLICIFRNAHTDLRGFPPRALW